MVVVKTTMAGKCLNAIMLHAVEFVEQIVAGVSDKHHSRSV